MIIPGWDYSIMKFCRTVSYEVQVTLSKKYKVIAFPVVSYTCYEHLREQVKSCLCIVSLLVWSS